MTSEHTTADVLVVGAGPVGLMLGAELRLAGVSVQILERLDAPTGLSKALGLVGRGEDFLSLRGLAERFRQCAPPAPQTANLHHFALIPLDIRLTTLAPKGIFCPQAITERLLQERALELGATIRRGVDVTGLVQDAEGVTVHIVDAGANATLRARFAVGCDGARSAVRKFSGIAFPGLEPTSLLRLGDVLLDDGAPLPPFLIPLGDGYLRVVTKEPMPEQFDSSVPLTLAELRRSIERTFKYDAPLREARWLSRFTDASRQAEHYRRGRVFLAGDAAHMHLPAGGPGLLTGLGDALNLGFKLGSVVRGDASDAILETYHSERHPVARRVLVHTRAQGQLTTPGEANLAVRETMAELSRIPAVTEHLLRMLWQLDTNYLTADDSPHALVGAFLPELANVVTPAGTQRIVDRLSSGKWLLIDTQNNADVRACVARTGASVEHLCAWRIEGAEGATQLLVRPDGHVAWAAPTTLGVGASLEACLRRWFVLQ